jgi:hypothetical protein
MGGGTHRIRGEPSMSKRFALAAVVAFFAGWVGAEVRHAAFGRGDAPTPQPFVSESQFAEALAPSVTEARPLYFYRESAYPEDGALFIADHPLAAVDLFKTPSYSERWKGVAWVATYRPSRADELAMSPLYRRVDGLVLYGDPDFIDDLLRRAGR